MDYKSIIEKCGIGKLPLEEVFTNIANLESLYDKSELINIYNYILMHVQNPEVLTQVIKYTDAYKSNSTLAILIDMLRLKVDTDEEAFISVRRMCAKAIANYNDTSVVMVLLDCLNDKKEHYRVRLACADALGRLGNKYAVRPLIDLVEDEEEKSIYLKESATFALGLLGDASAIDPLVSILESKHGFLDKFTFLKEKIVEALGKLNPNHNKVIKALKSSLMDSSPMVRINAIEAIMNSGNEESVDFIKPCLQDDDDEVKKNALIALYNLCGRDILDEVIELPIYNEFIKNEAQDLINEYEVDDE